MGVAARTVVPAELRVRPFTTLLTVTSRVPEADQVQTVVAVTE